MLLKKLGKRFLCAILEHQVRRLRAKNDITVVAVAGSVGKTSTKLAIAQALAVSKRVCYQNGNYNDRLTVPLVLFGQTEPNIFNVIAWAKLLLQNQATIHRPYPYDIAVLELGTDAPGQLADFAYLHPDVSVVTAVSEEHMEYFGTMDAVAHEELCVVGYSKQTLVNVDDTSDEYLKGLSYQGYGFSDAAAFRVVSQTSYGLKGQGLELALPGQNAIIETSLLGRQGAKIVLAAVAVLRTLGLIEEEVQQAVTQVKAFAGRMQVLPGVQDSTLIDDTYNASPLAVKAALDVLYGADTPQRIAILGSMNEMGDGSAAMHQDVGAYCDAAKLDLLVVIGKEAITYLAPAAKENGCNVMTFDHPRAAGDYVKTHLKDGAVVLAKGSQNGVFAEEALVPLLANPDDAQKLVRQSPYWQARKRQNLPKAPEYGVLPPA